MTHKLIKTDNYLLVVDDSDIKVYDYITDNYKVWKWNDDSSLLGRKKVICHLPLNNSPILEGVPLLPPLEDEVEKLVEQYGKREFGSPEYCFNKGYNKAKEKYKYTEEDLVWAIQEAYGHGRDEADDILYHQVEESIRVITKYLQQPKMPVGFESEMVSDIPSKEVMGEFDSRPKTTTNSQGQTVLVGTYKYE